MSYVRQPFNFNKTLIDTLYQEHVRLLLSSVRQQIGSLEDAEDIVLEVFVAALKSDILSRLNAQQQAAWLHTVARNKCVDYHRRSARKPTIPLETVVEQMYDDDECGPDRIALRHEEYVPLQQRLGLLATQQQEVLRLKFGYNLRSPEIARRLNKSESAVRTLLARALNHLRDIYANQSGGDES